MGHGLGQTGTLKFNHSKKYAKTNKAAEIQRISAALVRPEGFEPPAFWSVACLRNKIEPIHPCLMLFARNRTLFGATHSIVSVEKFSVLGQVMGQTEYIDTCSSRILAFFQEVDKHPYLRCYIFAVVIYKLLHIVIFGHSVSKITS